MSFLSVIFGLKEDCRGKLNIGAIVNVIELLSNGKESAKMIFKLQMYQGSCAK